ncbi:MAG: hydroxymethylbilane synthase [Pseudomonadota bacterium]
MELRLGARKSDLARLQAYQVGEALEKAHPNIRVQYDFRQSLGDKNLNDPLWKMPEKGVFTEDFREGLLKGKWDLVVHSWKDLPIDMEEGTELAATLPRADIRDMLFFKKSHFSKVQNEKKLRVYSSSPRRIYNLTPFFQEHFPIALDTVEFESVRGNILTRFEKLAEDNGMDGIIVAKAAIDRLLDVEGEEFVPGKTRLRELLSELLWQILPLSWNPAAAAQGALAVEISSGRNDLKNLLGAIHCDKTWTDVQKERTVLKSYGGGCHQKIGVSVLSRDYGEVFFLKGETEAGEVLDPWKYRSFSAELKKPLVKQPQWFEREEVPFTLSEGVNAHYVARSQSLPRGVTPGSSDIVWTSGLRTWKALARRGIWVHGTSDSLGEQEPMGLESLCENLHWVKWTHEEAPEVGGKQKVASYRLKPQSVSMDISEYEEFFWMSGSQFQEACRQFPELLGKKHFCGPGHTYDLICEVLEKKGIQQKPYRLPGYAHWQEMTKDK